MLDTIIFAIAAPVSYLMLGWVWAMLFIHRLTDGYWKHEGPFTKHIYRDKMGVGTALTMTLFWPAAMAACVMVLLFALISNLFSKNFWNKVYNLS